MLETNTSSSSMIRTNWIPRPGSAQLNNYKNTTDLPGAFLSVSIPPSQPGNDNVIISCSIDARWAMGTYSAKSVGGFPYSQKIEIASDRQPSSTLRGGFYHWPKDDGSWRRVMIAPEWLQTLTPLLNDSQPGWTSLASLLTSIGVDNSTGLIDDWARAASVIEWFTGLLVADAMSRQGFTDNINHVTEPTSWDIGPSTQKKLLAGSCKFPHPSDQPGP